MAGYGAKLPVTQAPRNGKCCPIAAVHLRPEDQRGPVKADIRTGFLRELRDCSANAGTAVRLSTLPATKQVLV